jgi:hypothetical protein
MFAWFLQYTTSHIENIVFNEFDSLQKNIIVRFGYGEWSKTGKLYHRSLENTGRGNDERKECGNISIW